MKFSDKTTAQLRSIIDKAVAGKDSIPGTAYVVTAKDGSEPFAYAAGKRGLTSDEPMTLDNVFWIASCTKMLVGLCCMQLVETGVLRLDDSQQVEDLCPELRHLKVLNKDGTLEPKKKGITLRMLLTHTSGFGYSFFVERLRDAGFPAGFDEFSGDLRDMVQPLLFQPGEGWEYGIGLDWAGIVLERATKTRLNNYLQEHICRPLGLKSVNMLPTPEMKTHLANMHQRAKDDKLIPRDHLHRRPLVVETPEERAALFQSGGAGVFATPREYARVIAVLLNDGTCPRTGAKLVEKATVDEMFKNQIPQFPQYGRQGTADAKAELVKRSADIYPTPGNTPQGWGLTFSISGGATGRAEGTGWWAGIANLYWWADRERGVGGMVATQILPFGDDRVTDLRDALETAVYQGLGEASG